MTVEAFKKHGVVPDVVPNAPTKKVSVKFDSGVEVSRLASEEVSSLG